MGLEKTLLFLMDLVTLVFILVKPVKMPLIIALPVTLKTWLSEMQPLIAIVKMATILLLKRGVVYVIWGVNCVKIKVIIALLALMGIIMLLEVIAVWSVRMGVLSVVLLRISAVSVYRILWIWGMMLIATVLVLVGIIRIAVFSVYCVKIDILNVMENIVLWNVKAYIDKMKLKIVFVLLGILKF